MDMGKSTDEVFFNRPTLLLSFSWITGLIGGAWAALQIDQFFLSWMRLAVAGRVSIISLMICSFLPFLFLAIAIFISKPMLIYPCAFGKAFSFSCLAFLLFRAFGSAGWLIQFLFQFSAMLLIPFYWWFAYRHCQKKDHYIFDLCVCLAATAVICGLDYFVICPLLGTLIDG